MDRRKILLLGATGQVGFELWQSLSPFFDVIPCMRSNSFGEGCELLDLSQGIKNIEHLVSRLRPHYIVNAVAYTAVDRAESERSEAELLNHDLPEWLGEISRDRGIPVIHFSTDYVYSGDGDQPLKEESPTRPRSVYGQTKLAGDQALLATGSAVLIFRTSWVFSVWGQNFVKTMLRLGKERDSLNVIQDQIGSPTSARTIAEVVCEILRRDLSSGMNPGQSWKSGIFHLCNQGYTSWFEFAEKIFEIAKERRYPLKVTGVQPIKTKDYPTPAMRPLNSRLSLAKLEATFGVVTPSWQQALRWTLYQLT